MGEVPAILRNYFGDPATPPLEHWSDERLRAYQTEAAGEQLAHVYAHSRFYRARLAKVEPVHRPCVVGYAASAGTPPLTLDDLL
jgi:hypothetical protein